MDWAVMTGFWECENEPSCTI